MGTDDAGPATGDGTVLTKNAYAVAFNYASHEGNKKRLGGLDEYDLLLSPTVSAGAFPVGEPPSVIDGREVDTFSGFFPFTYPINMIGHPAASIPCGFTSEDLPVGLHIVGRWGDEETIIAASAATRR